MVWLGYYLFFAFVGFDLSDLLQAVASFFLSIHWFVMTFTRDLSFISFLSLPLSTLHLCFAQTNCAQYAADRKEEETMCDHLISAAKHRDHVTANQLKQKIVNILTNKHGAWGAVAQRYGCVGLCVCFFNSVRFWPCGLIKNKLSENTRFTLGVVCLMCPIVYIRTSQGDSVAFFHIYETFYSYFVSYLLY